MTHEKKCSHLEQKVLPYQKLIFEEFLAHLRKLKSDQISKLLLAIAVILET